MNAPGTGQHDTEPRERTVQLTLDFDVTRVPTSPRRRPATRQSTATAELDLDPAPVRVPRRRREPTPDPPVYTATYEYIGEPDTEIPGTPNTPNGTSSRHQPRHIDARDAGTKQAARRLPPHSSNGSQKPRRQPLAKNRAPTQTTARAPPTRQSQYRRQGLSQLANSLPLRAGESRFSVGFVEYVRPRPTLLRCERNQMGRRVARRVPAGPSCGARGVAGASRRAGRDVAPRPVRHGRRTDRPGGRSATGVIASTGWSGTARDERNDMRDFVNVRAAGVPPRELSASTVPTLWARPDGSTGWALDVPVPGGFALVQGTAPSVMDAMLGVAWSLHAAGVGCEHVEEEAAAAEFACRVEQLLTDDPWRGLPVGCRR